MVADRRAAAVALGNVMTEYQDGVGHRQAVEFSSSRQLREAMHRTRRSIVKDSWKHKWYAVVLLLGVTIGLSVARVAWAADKPNIVMLMTDDTGWGDFGAYSGGGWGLGHPTPKIDQIAKEGVYFTSWYGQASCTAGRASFITGRIPIRSALSIVVAPGNENRLRKETPTIAEFFRKKGYTTYF
jgi:hypothetical protein